MQERLTAAWDAWSLACAPELAPKTLAEYRSCWRHLTADLQALDVPALLRWRASLIDRYAPPTVALHLRAARVIVRRASDITGDVGLWQIFAAVRVPRLAAPSPRRPQGDLLRACLTHARGPAESLWLRLAGLAGLRRGELLGLRPEDWQPETQTLRVVRQRGGGPRKNRRPHAVVLDVETARLVEWLVDHRAEVKPRQGWHRGRSDGYLFPWSRGYCDDFLARLRAALPGAFPVRCGWHLFRHWGAGELAASGASSLDVQRWLGDEDPGMASVYVATVRGETMGDARGLAARLARSARFPCRRVERRASSVASARRVAR